MSTTLRETLGAKNVLQDIGDLIERSTKNIEDANYRNILKGLADSVNKIEKTLSGTLSANVSSGERLSRNIEIRQMQTIGSNLLDELRNTSLINRDSNQELRLIRNNLEALNIAFKETSGINKNLGDLLDIAKTQAGLTKEQRDILKVESERNLINERKKFSGIQTKANAPSGVPGLFGNSDGSGGGITDILKNMGIPIPKIGLGTMAKGLASAYFFGSALNEYLDGHADYASMDVASALAMWLPGYGKLLALLPQKMKADAKWADKHLDEGTMGAAAYEMAEDSTDKSAILNNLGALPQASQDKILKDLGSESFLKDYERAKKKGIEEPSDERVRRQQEEFLENADVSPERLLDSNLTSGWQDLKLLEQKYADLLKASGASSIHELYNMGIDSLEKSTVVQSDDYIAEQERVNKDNIDKLEDVTNKALDKLDNTLKKGPLGAFGNISNILGNVRSGVQEELETVKTRVNSSNSTPTSYSGLGSLSKKYESSGKSSAINYSDAGGASYGKYQISSSQGTMNNFLKYLSGQGEEGASIAQQLRDSGDSLDGRGGFGKTWTELANSGVLEKYEDSYIKKTHYDDLYKSVKSDSLKTLIDENPALQEMMFSVGVQHGSRGGARLFNKVYKEGMSPEDLVNSLYDERSDVDKYFSKQTPAMKEGVKNRFKKERADVMQLLGVPPDTDLKDFSQAPTGTPPAVPNVATPTFVSSNSTPTSSPSTTRLSIDPVIQVPDLALMALSAQFMV